MSAVDYGRAGTKNARTRHAVHERLLVKDGGGEIPTNNRFVFYELEQDTRKHKRRSIGWPPGEQDVTDAVMWLRENGLVPWRWITDETRRVFACDYAPTVAEYLSDRLPKATINPWRDGLPPLMVCESKATAAVLRSAASEYVCPITGTGGQVGGFLHTEVAPLLAGNDCKVLAIGDLDKAGGDIERNTRRVLEREQEQREEAMRALLHRNGSDRR